MSAERILVVEDNAIEMSILAKRLIAQNYRVLRASSASEAVRAADLGNPDLMILDLTLIAEDRLNTPSWDGFSLLEWMRRILPGAGFPVIIHTGSPISSIATQARNIGVRCVFEKGEDLGELL